MPENGPPHPNHIHRPWSCGCDRGDKDACMVLVSRPYVSCPAAFFGFHSCAITGSGVSPQVSPQRNFPFFLFLSFFSRICYFSCLIHEQSHTAWVHQRPAVTCALAPSSQLKVSGQGPLSQSCALSGPGHISVMMRLGWARSPQLLCCWDVSLYFG